LFPGVYFWLGVGGAPSRPQYCLARDVALTKGEEVLLADLGERIRDVVEGPDGFLYLLTDSDDGRVLRIRP
ncbi:MAG: PQQ-dependent sugar dehydrogenase, partial [Hyphomicrobiales bacterium]